MDPDRTHVPTPDRDSSSDGSDVADRDRSAVVVGGASGIGLLTAQRLAAAGAARVVLWDIDAHYQHAHPDQEPPR